MRALLLLLAVLAVIARPTAAKGGSQDPLELGLTVVKKWMETHSLECGWEDGTFMQGVSALQQATNDRSLLRAMQSYGNKFAWDMCAKLGGARYNPDNQVCSATYLDLYMHAPTNNRTWVAAAIAQLDAEIANEASTKNWNWVDALFMAMSVYARVGALTGKQAYFDKMHKNFVYAALSPHPNGYGLWSQSDALFYRDPPKGSPSGVFWSRGNGWVAAALVQALRYAPAEDPHTQTYRLIYRQHMARLAQLQGADGCWCSSLTDPGFYPVPETTGTSLFTYAMGYGISAGLLEPTTFLPVVHKAWQCLTSVSLHADGTVGNCQPVGYAPQPDFGPSSTSSFCVGQFAMAATAVAQLPA